MAWQKIFIVVVFVAVVWNLGVALFHMMTDKGSGSKMVRSLTWRIGLSVGLILLVVLGIATGVVQPHGIVVGRPGP